MHCMSTERNRGEIHKADDKQVAYGLAQDNLAERSVNMNRGD